MTAKCRAACNCRVAGGVAAEQSHQNRGQSEAAQKVGWALAQSPGAFGLKPSHFPRRPRRQTLSRPVQGPCEMQAKISVFPGITLPNIPTPIFHS